MTSGQMWNDEYWPFIVQLYLKNPAGIKPMLSKSVVDLSLELHILPSEIYARLLSIDKLDTPRIKRIWRTYSVSPRKLNKAVRTLRNMNGFGMGEQFYEGVAMSESFEHDLRAIEGEGDLMPVTLIPVLHLYFLLIPMTMECHTPEVRELGRLLKQKPETIVRVLHTFLLCDPFVAGKEGDKEPEAPTPSLLAACKDIWQRYANIAPDELEDIAVSLRQCFS